MTRLNVCEDCGHYDSSHVRGYCILTDCMCGFEPISMLQHALYHLIPQYSASEHGRWSPQHQAVRIVEACFTLVMFTRKELAEFPTDTPS